MPVQVPRTRDVEVSLMRVLPGWIVWWGPANQVWWALPPRGHQHQALVGAADPASLAAWIRHLDETTRTR
jgi:hypothetical protein